MVSNFADVDIEEKKLTRERQKEAFTVATLKASTAAMHTALLDISNRKKV